MTRKPIQCFRISRNEALINIGRLVIVKQDETPRQRIYVVIVLIIAAAISSLLFVFKPVADKKPVREKPPVAEYVIARPEQLSIPVYSQGSVSARQQIKLVAEVNGRVKRVAEHKFRGERFREGELLVEIDNTDYQLSLARSQAQVAAAEQQLSRVESEARQARFDLQQMGRSPQQASDYALRKPQLAEARANLRAARAELELAELQLQRTRIYAPFNGRVISRQVDEGQYVTTGFTLAEIYATDSMEVKLPLSLEQLKHLDIGLMEAELSPVDVELTAEIAGTKAQWNTQLSYVESQVDPRNRLLNAVAEIKVNHSVKDALSVSLTPGMFVKAELRSRKKRNIVRLPEQVLRSNQEVWLIDENDQLIKRKVKLLTRDKDTVYFQQGIALGERVILNVVDFPVKGMRLTPKQVKQTAAIDRYE